MLDIPLLYIGSNQDSLAKFSQFTDKLTIVQNESEALGALTSKSYEGIIIDSSIPFELALDIIERISMVKKLLLSLIVTNDLKPANLLRAIRLNITDVLTSPIDMNQLNSTLSKLKFWITKQKQLAQKTSLLNQYKNALDTSLYIIRTNIEGVIVYVNDKYTDLTGYSSSEIIGETHRLFKHPDTSKEQMNDLWKTIKSKRVWHGTIINQTKEGKTFYSDAFVIPILNELNEIEEFMDMRIDITEIKNYLNIIQQKVDEATQEIQNQQQQLIAQSRSAALGEMFDNIAHQWRQPIGAINNAIINAEFALELGNMDVSEIHTTFTQINKYTAFLSKTIDDFRNFSNPSNEKTTFYLHDIIEQTISIVHGSYSMSQITLIYEPDEAAHSIQTYGPQGELAQVILNILGNARDAITEKGISQGIIHLALTMSDAGIKLTISDNAGGIPQEVLPKIFDPYFTTKTKAHGTGIGLYMSKTIIEKHFEGNIEAKNTEQGAIFTICLPSV